MAQISPVRFRDPYGGEIVFFVEAVGRQDNLSFVLGWASDEEVEFAFIQGDHIWTVNPNRYSRRDVADALMISGTGLGFSVVSDGPDTNSPIQLEIRRNGTVLYSTGVLADTYGLTVEQSAIVPELSMNRLRQLGSCEFGSNEWWDSLNSFNEVEGHVDGCVGFIEGVIVSPEGGGIVFGWVLNPANAIVWLEDERQGIVSLEQAFRINRADIHIAFESNPWVETIAGFVAYMPRLKLASHLRLRVACVGGVSTLSSRSEVEMLPSQPLAAAKKLFSILTPVRKFHERVAIVDWKLLEPLISRKTLEFSGETARCINFGEEPNSPGVSVIVPLYKRFDFIEHQILEFRRDPAFADLCEVIYVVDDPSIQETVIDTADELHRLFDFPFKIVVSERNRGYSGANNLGAAYARGQRLLFLNSDVIPNGPGWLEPMLDLISHDNNIGAVGARLVFASGGIQHAGIEIEYLPNLSIWINQHPGAGLPPELDSAQHPCDKLAITGACLLIERSLFNKVGGWDTGYLVGDFEDSDLCFKLREQGYRIVYQPKSQLVHLERQSFVGIGDNSFRQMVTIANAVRHQQKWKDLWERELLAAPIQKNEKVISK